MFEGINKVFIKNDFSGNLLFVILTEFIDIVKVNDFIDKLKCLSHTNSLVLEKSLGNEEVLDYINIANAENSHKDMLNNALRLVLSGPKIVEAMLTPQGHIKQSPQQRLDNIHLCVEDIKFSVKGAITAILNNCEDLEVLERNAAKILNEASLFIRSKNSMKEKAIFTSKVILLPIAITLFSFISGGLVHLGRKK